MPNPTATESLLSCLFIAALFGLRKLDPHRGKATRPDDWRRVWQLHVELGCPPLPCTAPWMDQKSSPRMR